MFLGPGSWKYRSVPRTWLDPKPGYLVEIAVTLAIAIAILIAIVTAMAMAIAISLAIAIDIAMNNKQW